MVKNLSITLAPGPVEGVYTAGSPLSGSLTVEVDTPKHYEKITVHLLGQGYVYWSSGKHTDTEKKACTGSEDYVDLQQVVWKKEQSPDGTLPAGRHTFPFQFGLPLCCPSSYHSFIGNIYYNITGVISTGPHKPNHKVKVPLDIVEVVSTDEDSKHHFRVETRKRVGVGPFKSGDITYTVELPSTSFTVGEDIPVSWYVENGSGRQVSLRCSLVEKIRYYVEEDCRDAMNTLVSQTGITIPPHTASEDTVNVPIPPCRPAMTRSNIIKSDFKLVATVVVPWATDSHIEIPVKIGNESFLRREQSPSD